MGGDDLRLLRKADLRSFNMVIAFRGWPDAKRVATYAAEYLRDKLQAEKIGEIDSKAFYDLIIQRPLVNIESGLMKEHTLPQNELYVWKDKKGARDLLMLIGEEPHINWFRYVEPIFQVLELGKVRRICLFGGVIDRIPHTVEPLISGVATTQKLVEEMKRHGVEPTDYVGPGSIHSLIMRESGRLGIPALSVWGHAPQYIGDADVRTAHQLLCKVEELLGIEVDLEDIRREGNLLRKQLDALMKQDRAFSETVHQLELEYEIARGRSDYIA